MTDVTVARGLARSDTPVTLVLTFFQATWLMGVLVAASEHSAWNHANDSVLAEVQAALSLATAPVFDALETP